MNYQDNRELQDALVASFFVALLMTTVSAFTGYPAVMAWGISLMLTLMLGLGASRNGTTGAFKPFLILALIAWLVSFSLLFTLSSSTDALVGGLPPATAAAVYGLWIAPLLLVTIPYALLFHKHVLDDEVLDELERIARKSAS